MNFAKTFKGLVLGSALLLATGAFAASKGPLQLTRSGQCGRKATSRRRLHREMGRQRPQRASGNPQGQECSCHCARTGGHAGPCIELRFSCGKHGRRWQPRVVADPFLR